MPEKLELDDVLVRNREVVWRWGSGVVVLLPPGSEEPVQIDGSGPTVWALLSEPIRVTDLLHRLGAMFDHPPEALEAPVIALLSELVDLRAVMVTAHDPSEDVA